MNSKLSLNFLGSLTMLLLFAAASFAQGDEKISTALRGSGISVSAKFHAGETAERVFTARVKLGNAESRSASAPVAAEWVERSSGIRGARSIELSKYLLLCVALDENGEAVWLSSVADPRRIRAEVPDESGALTGREVDDPDPEIIVAIPADRGIREVRIFHPEWNGHAFDLIHLRTVEGAMEARTER